MNRLSSSPHALSRAAFFTLLITACIFGANHVAARLAFNHGLDVTTAVLVRSFVTAAVVGGLVWLQLGSRLSRRRASPKATSAAPVGSELHDMRERGGVQISPRQRGFLLLISALLAVQRLCRYAAVARLPVALALLTFNTYPL